MDDIIKLFFGMLANKMYSNYNFKSLRNNDLDLNKLLEENRKFLYNK